MSDKIKAALEQLKNSSNGIIHKDAIAILDIVEQMLINQSIIIQELMDINTNLIEIRRK